MRAAVAVVALLTFTGAAARGAEPNADDLIVRGLQLRRAAQPGDALEMFRRAHALAPSPRTLGQMGLVEASLEHWLDADAHLTAALSTPGDVWVRKNRAFLVHAANVSRAHIGEVVVTGPAGTDVALDGKNAGILPEVRPVRMAEGKVVITANSAGFKDFSKTITIVGGAKVSVAIVLDPIAKWTAVAIGEPLPLAPGPAALPASTAAAPLADAGPLSRSWRTPAGAGLVAAGAGLIAWGITWIVVDRHDDCPMAGPACNEVYATRTPGWLLTAGGVVAAGVGAVLLSLGEPAGSRPIALGLTSTSVSLRGRF